MINIRNYNGTLDDMVFAIGNMHYDVTALVLDKIAYNIMMKACNENNSKLREISDRVYEAKEYIDIAWKKCKDKMKGECSKHPTEIEGFSGNFDELGQDISKSSYKDLISFLEKMGDDLFRQAEADWNRTGVEERKQLATQLYSAANSLYKVK